MREGNGREYAPAGAQQDDEAMLSEMVAWAEGLREAGVSEMKIAQALSVPRASLNRVLRNRRWTERTVVYQQWMEKQRYLLLLDAGGLLALLEAASEARRRETADAETEMGDGTEPPEMATEAVSTAASQAAGDRAPAQVSSQASEELSSPPDSEEYGTAPGRTEVEAVPDDTASTQDQTTPKADTDGARPTVAGIENDTAEQGLDDGDEYDEDEQEREEHRVLQGGFEAANGNEGGDAVAPAGLPQAASAAAKRRGKPWLIERIRAAETIEEVANVASASVLNWVPGLTLEQAKEAAQLKVSGWNPAVWGSPKPSGFHGDAALLLWAGAEVAYRDEGAREVAFAPTLQWEDEMPYCAHDMRYGVPSSLRQRRYAVDAHDEEARGDRLGYRPCSWVPEKPYPDSDWFFGSEGNLRADGTWWPSRAEALHRWYDLRDMFRGYGGTEADLGASIWYAEIERAMLKIERFLLDVDYRMTFHYHGRGRVIPHHTRIAERRWMAMRRVELDEEIRLKRRRRRILRVISAPFRALVRPLSRSLERSASRRFYEAQTEKALAAAMTNMDTVSAPALMELVPEVCGELGWKALDPPWDRRDRTRWYDAGTGPLSPEGEVVNDPMQVLDTG